jgi:hypothetical protein
MKTPATDNTIAFLMASNNEEIAQDLADEITALKLELERVKGVACRMNEYHEKRAIDLQAELERVKEIAMHRLEVHAQRMTFVAERDSDLARELANRFPLTQELVTDAPKTRQIRDREREELDAMIAKNNEWLEENDARIVVGEGGLWGAFCRGEI